MSEPEFGDLSELPPAPKKGVPGWLWFCGGGCLLMTVIAIVLVFLGIGLFRDATNPDVQWPKLQERLATDEIPESHNLIVGIQWPVVAYTIEYDDSHLGIIVDLEEATAAEREKIFSEEFSDEDLGLVDDVEDAEQGLVVVQGRELSVLRFQGSYKGQPGNSGADMERQGHFAMADLTPEGAEGLLMLLLIKNEGDERISDEELGEFLEPFHIGPDR